MLADLTTHVIGVDTHRDTHTFATLESKTGGVLRVDTVPADQSGYELLLIAAEAHCSTTQRAWAVEGTGSYGAGLTACLQARGEWVIEVERPSRNPRRDGRKSDDIDAVRAARDVLGREVFAQPRSRGDREALRLVVGLRDSAVITRTSTINQLKAIIVGAPEPIRAKLRHTHSPFALRTACLALRAGRNDDYEARTTIDALHQLARRIRALDVEIKAHDKSLGEMTTRICPKLLEETGVGPVTAAGIYLGWSHAGRCRNESAFAMLAGAAPLEASSGRIHRHRLNRGGDRQLNRALHTVVVSRAKCDDRTKTYVERRIASGKTKKEAYRCLTRYLARHFYRLLESTAAEEHSPRT